MSTTDETRYKVYEAFRASHGDEVANGLMEMLPPVGWADVATKQDVRLFKQDIERLRQDLDSGLGGLRHDLDSGLGGLRHDLDAGLGGLRHDLDAGLGGLRQEMDARFAASAEWMDARFQMADERLTAVEARLGERLERAVREQSTRFFVWVVSVAGISVTASGIIQGWG